MEIWKDIPGWDGYKISTLDNVTNGEKNLCIWINHRGYKMVTLCRNGIKKNLCIHYLKQLSFVGKRPRGYDINHIDGVKLNNDLSNLEYCTRSKNAKHAYRTRLRIAPNTPKGSKSIFSRKVLQFSIKNEFMKLYGSLVDAGIETKTDTSSISKVCRGKKISAGGFIWKYQ